MGDVAQSVIADDLSQIVVGGVGSDVLQGRGGADTYNIIGGDASGADNLYTDYEGNAIVGDIINEIGGRLADKGDSVQFSDSSANSIDVTDISQFSFERVRIRNEDEGSTLRLQQTITNGKLMIQYSSLTSIMKTKDLTGRTASS